MIRMLYCVTSLQIGLKEPSLPNFQGWFSFGLAVLQLVPRTPTIISITVTAFSIL